MNEMISGLPETIKLVYVPALLLAVLIHFLAEPLRWYFYTNKSFNTSYKQLFNIFSLTALITYMLPMKMGIPTRIFLIRVKSRIGIIQCSALLMLDGVINYACWGVTSLISLYLLARLNILELNIATGLAASLFILFLMWFIWKKRHLLIPRKINDGINIAINKDNHGLNKLLTSLNIQTLIFSASVMLLDIVSHVARHWAIFSMLDIDLAWSTIFIITTISLFTGIISMMPMGLGGYDAMLVLLLTQFSVAPEHAISIAIINRITSLFVSLIAGIYGGVQLNINPFKKSWREQIAGNNTE